MDDQFLKQYREPPRAEFARQLQDRIDGGSMNVVKQKTWRQNLMRWSPAFLAAVIVVAAVLVITLPPAGALAQDFLGLFRVKKFATVTVDPARMQQLGNLNIDTEQLFADNVKVLQEPGKPVSVGSVQEASTRAGFAVSVPAAVPQGAKLQASVEGAGSAVVTANVAKAQEILDMVGVNDVKIPSQLDGAKITITKPASVILNYTLQNGTVSLMQSPSPQVELPPGVELKQLGEIGLRVLGLSKEDAHTFAANVDWSSTFLIPIPANAEEVRQVTVNGADGLMLTSSGASFGGAAPKNANTKKQGKPGAVPPHAGSAYANGQSVILWAKNGMVYAMQGSGSAVNLLELANSVQ